MSGSNGTLSEFERVKLENFALKNNILQQQVQANLLERVAFINTIEESHPGYRWSDPEGLVKSEPS
jgi:hypothetical protein